MVACIVEKGLSLSAAYLPVCRRPATDFHYVIACVRNSSGILMRFMRESRENPRYQTIGNSILALESQFPAHIRKREMFFLDEVTNLKRGGDESIRSFWIMYEATTRQLSGRGITLPDNTMSTRTPKALHISPSVILSIITRLDCKKQSHTLTNLRCAR